MTESRTDSILDGLLDTRRFAWVAWLLVVAGICVRVDLQPHRNTFYPIFVDAARNWQAGENLYYRDAEADQWDKYRYSPVVAVLLSRFSMFPDDIGGILWRLSGVGLFCFAFWLFSRHVLDEANLASREVGLLWLLVLPLAIGSINNGQANVHVAGLLLLATAAAVRDGWNLAAVCIVAATCFKIYPLAIGLLFIITFPRQFAGRFLLFLVAALLTPFLFQRIDFAWGQYASWIQHLSESDTRRHAPMIDSYRDLWLLCRVFFGSMSSSVYFGLQLLMAALVAAVCWSTKHAGGSRPQVLQTIYFLGTSWLVLCGPSTESCTYILLGPAFAWATMESFRRGSLLAQVVMVLVAVLFVAYHVGCWFPRGRDCTYTLQPCAGLLLFAYLFLVRIHQFLPDVADQARVPGHS